MEGELSAAEPQLHANGWESVFQKMPFLTLLNTRTTNVVRNAGCARSRYTRNFF